MVMTETNDSMSIWCSNICGLPIELLDFIVRCLSKKDQKQLRQTNLRLCQLVTPLLFKSVALIESNWPSTQMIPCQSFLRSVTRMPLESRAMPLAEHVKSLRVKQRAGPSVQLLSQLLQVCPNISSLTIPSHILTESCNIVEGSASLRAVPQEQDRALAAHLGPLLDGQPGITKLMLTGQFDQRSVGAFIALVPKLIHLRSLEVGVAIPVFLLQQHCPQLQTLVCHQVLDDYHLVESKQREKGKLNRVMQPWTSLTELSTRFLTNNKVSINTFLAYLCIKLPSLAILHLFYDGFHTVLMNTSFGVTFQHLRNLTFTCEFETEEALSVISQFGPNLTSLTLNLGDQDVDMAPVLKAFLSLQHLCIYNEGLLTCDITPEANLTPMNALRSLDISERYIMPPTHSSGVLENISTLCPSLNRLGIVFEDWVLHEPRERIKEVSGLNCFYDRLDKVVAHSPSPPTLMLASLPHSNLCNLSVSFCKCPEAPGLIMLVSADKLTVLKAWYIGSPDDDQHFDVRLWGNNTPPALEALVNWEFELADTVPAPHDDAHNLGYVGIIILPLLPQQFYLESKNMPMK